MSIIMPNSFIFFTTCIPKSVRPFVVELGFVVSSAALVAQEGATL